MKPMTQTQTDQACACHIVGSIITTTMQCTTKKANTSSDGIRGNRQDVTYSDKRRGDASPPESREHLSESVDLGLVYPGRLSISLSLSLS